MYKAFSFLLLGVLISVALMSFWSPYVGDDYIWLFASHGSSFPVGTDSAGGSAVASAGMFARILEMVGIHYMTLNGRILSNFFSGMFGAMSATGYACCNAVVFVLLVYLVWRMSGLKDRWQPIVAFLLVALLVRYDAVLWRSATSNYLWPAVCALALALLWERMERGVRVWQFWGLVFVAFLTAGGHELIDFGVCTMLLVYWIVYWVRRHRLPLDGRMALSCGCVLGSLSLVFAPGTLRRAGGAGVFDLGGSLLFSTAAFMRALLRCLVDCPPLAVVIGVVMWMFVRRRWNWFVGRRHSYPLICWAVVLFFTCFLTDGVGRTSWLLSAVSLFVLFVMVSEYELHFSDRFVRVCSVMLGIVVVGVVTLSCCQAYAAKSAYDAMLEKWRDDSDGFFVGRQWVLPKGLGWFDRTARLDSLLHFGAGYPNHLVARSYGRTHLIRVTEDMRRHMGFSR